MTRFSINGSKIIWMAKFDAKAVIAAMPRATVFMGVPTLYVRMLAEPLLTREAASRMRLFIFQDSQALLRRARAAAQHDGQSAEESAA